MYTYGVCWSFGFRFSDCMCITGWCVCVRTIRAVVLWYVSPTWTTHYYRRYFVLYNCIVKVTSWLSAGMICHKFKYQLIEHTKYTFHEICGLLVSVTYTEFETSSVVSCRESQHCISVYVNCCGSVYAKRFFRKTFIIEDFSLRPVPCTGPVARKLA